MYSLQRIDRLWASRTVNTVQTAAGTILYSSCKWTPKLSGMHTVTLITLSRGSQRSSPSMTDVSSLVLPATEDDALFLFLKTSLAEASRG